MKRLAVERRREMARGAQGAGADRSGRAWGIALAAIGLLLFTWPFVRTPPLGLLGSYLHLLVSWAVVIAAIWATTRKDRHGRDADA